MNEFKLTQAHYEIVRKELYLRKNLIPEWFVENIRFQADRNFELDNIRLFCLFEDKYQNQRYERCIVVDKIAYYAHSPKQQIEFVALLLVRIAEELWMEIKDMVREPPNKYGEIYPKYGKIYPKYITQKEIENQFNQKFNSEYMGKFQQYIKEQAKIKSDEMIIPILYKREPFESTPLAQTEPPPKLDVFDESMIKD